MKISVIIPAYNSGDTIIKALDSLFNQTYPIYEIIIINDGSVDDTLNKIYEYKELKVKSLINIEIIDKENGGVSSARNAGLKLAKGELIALLDSDDEWLPNKLEIQIKFFDKFDFVTSSRNNESIGFPYKVINNEYASLSLKKLLFKVTGHTSTAVFRRSILDNVGYFDEEQKYSEDANFWMKISINYKMIIINQSLVITGGGKPSVGHSGLSANLKGMECGVQKNIKEMYDLGYINFFEFLFFKFFSSFKYVVRLFRI